MKWDKGQVGLIMVVAAAVVILAWPQHDDGESSRAGENSRFEDLEKEEGVPKRTQSEAAKTHTAERCLARLVTGGQSDRAKAVAILRNLGEDALVLLREQFAREGDSDVRRDAAAFALAVLGNATDKDNVAEAFLDAAGRPSGLLASAAAELKDPALTGQFMVLVESKDAKVRAAVARAMRADHFPNVAALMPLLADPEPRVRAVAENTLVGMLRRLPERDIAAAAKAALKSPDRAMRVTALQMCARVDKPWAVELATRAASDKDGIVRAQAVETLRRTGDVRAAPPLTRLLETGNGRHEKVRAASALAYIDAPKASIEALAKAARGDDPLVALAAARALVAHRDPRGVATLVSLRNVRQSRERDIDDEDSMLLASLSRRVLKSVEGKAKRRRGEDWDGWWARVGRDFKFPKRSALPKFPKDH